MQKIRFKQYLNEQVLTEEELMIHEINLLQLALALGQYDVIQEDLMTENLWQKTKDVITDFASQFDMRDSLGKYILKIGNNSGKMLLAAIKGDKERMQELKGRFNREDFFELLYRLDNATLGLLTGPIGLIEEITGIDIKGWLKKQVKSTKKHIQNIISTFDKLKKDVAMVFRPSKHPDVFNAIDDLKKTMKIKLKPLVQGKIKVSINKGIKA